MLREGGYGIEGAEKWMKEVELLGGDLSFGLSEKITAL